MNLDELRLLLDAQMAEVSHQYHCGNNHHELCKLLRAAADTAQRIDVELRNLTLINN